MSYIVNLRLRNGENWEEAGMGSIGVDGVDGTRWLIFEVVMMPSKGGPLIIIYNAPPLPFYRAH